MNARSPLRLVLLIGVVSTSPFGCTRVDYPEVAVQSSVGHPGICSHCGKKLADVQDDNLIEVDHIQFIICDHDCAAGVIRWMAEQGER